MKRLLLFIALITFNLCAYAGALPIPEPLKKVAGPQQVVKKQPKQSATTAPKSPHNKQTQNMPVHVYHHHYYHNEGPAQTAPVRQVRRIYKPTQARVIALPRKVYRCSNCPPVRRAQPAPVVTYVPAPTVRVVPPQPTLGLQFNFGH